MSGERVAMTSSYTLDADQGCTLVRVKVMNFVHLFLQKENMVQESEPGSSGDAKSNAGNIPW